MSAATLETLRAQFEAARDHFLREYVAGGGGGYANPVMARRLTPDGAKDYFTPEEWSAWGVEQSSAAIRVGRTAMTYCIARDHGLQAAMLFKLSDGAIDPRGAA